ncbi:MAG: energy-coupling factor transporter transmembrane protein EcfT [Ruminococcaceae bacterium]|nr:energy-coupling factor transporter transmembrane protein EcfT [Oscillospiraceae bacterium]
MLGDITIGQYYPAKSVVHRIDPRVKILLMLALIVIAFVAQSVPAALLVTVATFVSIIMTRVPLRMYFKNLKAIWFLVLLTSVLNMFYFKGQVLWQWGPLSVTYEGIRQSCFVAQRLVCLILLSSALTFTATPTELTGAIESLLSPLKIFGVKVHELAMLMTIALRFVPTLLEESEKIMSAQKARGADLESGGLLARVKALIPILVPLIVSAFRRAYDLALAMECRCYTDGKGRTRLNEMKLRFRDFAALLVVAAVCVGVVMLNRTAWQDVLADIMAFDYLSLVPEALIPKA